MRSDMYELESIQILFGRTLEELSHGSWSKFLKTAAWTFKYKYPDQLLIYAQKPDATACASIDIWNRKLNRTVRSGAAHIALLDDSGDDLKLYYVVDVSDTEGSGKVPLWQLTAENEDYVLNSLSSTFDVEFYETDNITEFIKRIAERLVEEEMPQAAHSLHRIQARTKGLRDLSSEASEGFMRDLLIYSVTAVMMYRCGFEPDFISGSEDPFKNIELFSDPQAMSILGQTTQSLSRSALLVVAKAVQKWNRTHREEFENVNELSESRGVSDPGTDNRGARADQSLRSTEEALSEGTPSERIYSADFDRAASEASKGSGRTDSTAGSETHAGDGENRSGSEQGFEQHSMDNAQEEITSEGRGADSSENDLRIDYPEASEYGITVSFPSFEEQQLNISSPGLLSIPQEEINLIITSDFGNKVDLKSIYEFFKTTPDFDETVRFLDNVYSGLEDSVFLPDGRLFGVQALKSGLCISEDVNHTILPWYSLANNIRTLIEDNRYPVASEVLNEVPGKSSELKINQSISLKGREYLVIGKGDTFTTLQDVKHPIFTNTIPHSVLDVMLRNNYANSNSSRENFGVSESNTSDISNEVPDNSETSIETIVSSDNDTFKKTEDRHFKELDSEPLQRRNYRFLEYYAPEIIDESLDYIRFESDAFEPLYIERIAPGQLAIAHTYVQNGDLMYDPEIVFAIDSDSEELLPLSYEQSNPPLYRTVYEEAGSDLRGKNVSAERDINSFFRTWSQNLDWQEHKPVRGIKFRSSGDIEYTFDENRRLIQNEIDISENQEPLSLEDFIDPAILAGSSFENGKFRIYEHFQKGLSSKENIEFLKNEYGLGGRSMTHNGTSIFADHGSSGLKLWYSGSDKKELKVSWSDVAKKIDEYISRDKYLTEDEKLQYPEWLENQKIYRENLLLWNDYQKIVRDNPRSIVFYPTGDFYEVMGDSAKIVAEVCGLEVNSRPIHSSVSIPYSGIPSHLLEETISNLKENGNSVFVSSQESRGEPIAVGAEDISELSSSEYTVDSFHEGDLYEDAYGRGIITKISFEEYEGRHAAMFSYSDPEAKSGSRASKGYVMMMDAAIERLNRGEATLTPSHEIKDNRKNEEPFETKEPDELTLFDFVFDDDVASEPVPVAVPVSAAPSSEPSERINYHISIDQENYGGPKARFRNNIAAIKLLKQLESEARLVTPEEQDILAKYVGWGGIPEAFDSREKTWEQEYNELKELLTEDEYTSALESVLTSFYTPPSVTEAIYSVLDNLGFKRGNILDPCCGTGNFFGMLPESMRDSKLYGIELDSISGRISRQLYQNANILIDGYEKASLPDSFYDVAIGNVPFGSYKLSDRKYDKENFLIHDYFFAKTLDKVRPGGIVAFVTSAGTLDKANDSVRRYIAQRADLLGAIRLPDNTFKANAGTDVMSDIIFLQKRSKPMVQDADWISLDRAYNYETGETGPEINSYFVENPDMVLGDLVEVSGPYGPKLTCKARDGENLRSALQTAVANIAGEIDLSIDDPEESSEKTVLPADPEVRNFSYTLVDGDVYFRENSQMYKVDLNKTAEKRIKGMIELRDIAHALIDAQLEPNPSDAQICALQAKLNETYDEFTKVHGLINSRANSLAFSDDSAYFLLCSLEHVDDEGNFKGKADMFYKRTIGRHEPLTHTETAQEALAVCMGELGRVDLQYISDLCDLNEQEVLIELKGLVFPVPGKDGIYELSSIYLSGNVRKKLDAALAAAEADPKFNVNVEYLEKSLPEPLAPEDISVRLGATWVPADDVSDFIHELFEFDSDRYMRDYKDNIVASYEPLTDTWVIKNKSWDYRSIINTTYGTKRANAYRLLEDALNQKNTQIYDTYEDDNGKTRRVLNAEETIAARDKQELIKDKFKEWIWSNPERTERLSKLYNEKFNSVVPPEYDENMITFHGMNSYIDLEKHQKEAAARILYGGNTQLAHVVGAGKTWTMVAAAMEAKYLGLCNKSLIVVPNHLVGQWASAIYDLYPSAKVLASTKKDFETKNRKKFCSRIATGDYDIVVIGHSQFERIPLSIERQEATLREQISDITYSISTLKSERAESFTIKQMERMKKSLTAKLEKLQSGKKRDDVVTFEELGVDRLFIDESHEYKNLFLYTKMNNVAGISQTDSQKASDLFMKTRYIDEITGNMGNIHATGTPLSNTMAELYTTQRYLQYDLLNEMGLGSFDAWASTFGETVQSIELAPEGTGYRERTRFANFFNIPELVAIYKQVADVRTADMLNLPVPKVEYHTDVVPASEEQLAEVQLLAKRADDIRQRKVTNKDDNMLCITNDGRKLALDQRLLNPELPDNPNSKANACIENILKYYREGEEDKLTQLVFCDLSTPTGKGFNVYQDLKEKLVSRGIPEEEISFIHEANSDVQKEALFSKVRSGAVRILLGSTGKMGTGTNVQDRLIAGHDLDCPWRPSDLEQRAGRVIRRGNSNDLVHIHRYVTENTFDAYMYQLIEAKQRFASQIFTSKSPVRVAADVDESVLNYSQIKALASGNPKIKEKIELEIELARLKTVENNYKREQRGLDHIIRTSPDKIESARNRLVGLEADAKRVTSAASRTEKGELIPAEVKGFTYETQSDAGNAIFAAMKKLPERDKWFCIGHLRGFKIMAYQAEGTGYGTEPKLSIAGERSYPISYGKDGAGLMVRLNNMLDNGISTRVDGCKAEIEELERTLESAKSEFGKPFASAGIIEEKRRRLKVLEDELNLDAQKTETHNIAIEEDTATVYPETKRSLSEIVSDAQQRSVSQGNYNPGPYISHGI